MIRNRRPFPPSDSPSRSVPPPVSLLTLLLLLSVLGPGCSESVPPANARSESAAPPAALLPAPVGTPGAPEHPGTLVVDLDAVAKAMGWDDVIAKRVDAATQSLNAQLIQAAENLEKELKQIQADLGANPTEQQLAHFQQSKLRVQQTVQNNKALAEQVRDAVRAEQILLFRKEIKPVTGQIARERRAEAVLIANQNVVWFDSKSDITGDVIARFRARASEAPPAEKSASPPDAEPAAPDAVGRTNGSPGPSTEPDAPSGGEVSKDPKKTD